MINIEKLLLYISIANLSLVPMLIIVSMFSKQVRWGHPFIKTLRDIKNTDSNPHWYTSTMNKSYILRFMQYLNLIVVSLSPLENFKSLFKKDVIENNIDIKRVKDKIAPAYITEFFIIFDLTYVFIVSIFYSNFNNNIKFYMFTYIAFNLIILFERIIYKSFLKFICHPERTVHNIGRSVVLLLFNYIYIILGFSILYQIDFVSLSMSNLNTSFVDFIYYSTATISTLGFGDIHPTSSYGQILTTIEVIMGFVILVISIGKLIGSTNQPCEAKNLNQELN